MNRRWTLDWLNLLPLATPELRGISQRVRTPREAHEQFDAALMQARARYSDGEIRAAMRAAQSVVSP